MKQGTTPTLDFKLDIEISNVTEVVFTFTDELKYLGTSLDEEPKYLLQKNYPDDVTFEDDTFKLPLTQEETDLLTNTFFVEAQVICDKAVVKSDIKKVNMPHTLWTTYVDDNESNGQSEVIHLSFSDYVKVEGGSTGDYTDLTNKPRINNIELIGNKTTSDLGLDIEVGDGLKREGNVVSVDRLDTDNNALVFSSGKLNVSRSALARNSGFRMDLTSTDYANALVSKTYVDSLVSTSLKRLVVQTLPQNPNTYTIYMILRSAPTTNNIYDEYMYINNAWELIGSTEVDLSNYYTKTESNQTFEKQLATENGITITRTSASSTIGLTISSYLNGNKYLKFNANPYGLYLDFTTMYTDGLIVSKSTFDNGMLAKQDKLTAGTNITIDSNNVISASGGGLSYTFTDGLTESSGTVGIDLASGSKLLIDSNDKLDVDLSSKQDTIDSSHKLSADNVDDTNTTNKFTNTTEKTTWNNKADNTTISTDTTSTTVSLTLADNHEYRFTQDLASLTLTMPSGDFIASVVFSSGSTPTSMTYDSSIKWSGDDVTNNAFVPVASKTYNIVFWYDGININAISRSA